MIHIDLFSGLGLFSYAADHVWSLEHIFCEIEVWPYRFLKQEYPNVRIEKDIKNFDGTEYSGRTFLLTASFPCQPISVAGKRLGTKDDRWLWPQTIAIARCVQPEWVIFENVAGLTSIAEQYSPSKMENKTVQRLAESDLYEKIFSRQEILSLGIIIDDIEKAGFELPKLIDGTPIILCVPACAIGAVHQRDRVWLVARNTKSNSVGEKREVQKRTNPEPERGNSNAANTKQPHHRSEVFSKEIEQSKTERPSSGISRSGENASKDAQDTNSGRFSGQGVCEKQSRRTEAIGSSKDVADSDRFNGNNAGHGSGEVRGEFRKEAKIQGCDYWQKPWPEVATELCRVDVSPTDRVHRLKALGNTIQWEIAMMIMQAIKEIEVTT